jgi:glyoxylase-like metal-dependent hydrolase (beta-lactamase superfamily II)
VSLLHQQSGVLITGDSIFNMNGRMTWPVRAFCTDFPLTQRTAAALADLDYRVAAFTHGPQIDIAAREAVRGFLRRKGVVG